MGASKLTQRDLVDAFDYDREAGKLYWKHRDGSSPQWNGKWAGKEAGSVSSNGYLLARINGESHLVHRIIWFREYGAWPQEIDHVDQCRTNNRMDNLREVDRTINSQNHGIPSNNSSGHVGVHFFKRTSQWAAYIGVNGKRINLGYFSTADEAARARQDANERFGFHENHGRKKAA